MDNKRNNRRKNERKELICAVTAVVVLYMAMESIGITCPIKFITGISCAGCGMSRAWLAFLQLDMAKKSRKDMKAPSKEKSNFLR